MSKAAYIKQRNALKKDIEQLRDTLSLTASDLRGQAKNVFAEKFEHVKDRTAGLQESVVDYVNHKPLKALSIAVATGLVLGFAMRKKKIKYKHYNNR